MDKSDIWKLVHIERAAMADTLEGLNPSQWAERSLCAGWSVKVAAAHILAGAELTRLTFVVGLTRAGFRFNTMMDRDARRLSRLPAREIIEGLRARTTTTNGPGAPPAVLLGEVIVHGGDVRHPLGLVHQPSREALVICFDMYKDLGYPLGVKKRIEGLRLVATDVDWSHGTGPEVSGPALPLLLAMTGRPAGLADLTGSGMSTLPRRMPVHVAGLPMERGARQLQVGPDLVGAADVKIPEATQIVDLFYAREHLSDLARHLEFMLGDHKDDWLAARMEDLDYGDIDGIGKAARAYPSSAPACSHFPRACPLPHSGRPASRRARASSMRSKMSVAMGALAGADSIGSR